MVLKKVLIDLGINWNDIFDLKNFQVKDVEQTAQALIDTKVNVYAKECKLSDAKEINGLRAVFNEVWSWEIVWILNCFWMF